MLTVADRYKRAAIIGATAWLPKSWRVRSRTKLLWDFQRKVTQEADAVIIVHPKSGGTWLRVMLFRLFQVKYGLPPRRVMKTDELKRFNPALPRLVVSNGFYSYEAAVHEVLATASSSPKPLILLSRNPCDIAVSWYLQFTLRISNMKRELIVHKMRQPVDYKTLSLWDFVMNEELGLPALIAYHNRWADFFTGRENSLIVRYEDLRANPQEVLRHIAALLGEKPSDVALDDAVQFAAFDNLRKLEETNYFRNAGLRVKNRNDPNSYKVRRGKVGGFRDYLEPAQVDEMVEMVRARLNPVFGYG